MSVSILTTYQENLTCQNLHEPSGTTMQTTAPLDNGGKGNLFSPTDLVATALGSCMITIMAKVGERDGLNLKGMNVRTEKIMVDNPGMPRKIGELKLNFHLPNSLTETHRKKLERAAHTCPVKISIEHDIKITCHFNFDL